MAVTRMSRSSILTPGRSNDISGPGDKVIGISALIIAGGGGASSNNSYYTGAGGAGGILSETVSIEAGTYTCTVGAGGAAVATGYITGNQGNDSVFGPLTANAGGYGGTGGNPGSIGGPGGSGGGSGYAQSGERASDGTGQGANGGFGYAGANNITGGGGGGYEGGNDRNISWFRTGGHGRFDSIISTTVATAEAVGEVAAYAPIGVDLVWYSGGGGGAASGAPYVGEGGLGGGGDGGGSYTPQDGVANTGGGGGGCGTYQGGKAGGSGVVIIRLSTDIRVSVSAGLTYSTDTSVSDSIAYIFKSGTGTVTLA